jgi:superfamily II DNA or RNA helicase
MELTRTTPIGIQLRDYQQELVQKIYTAWADGKKRVIAQLPTGSGKTVCFAQIAKDFASKKEGVLVLAHRQELIEQAANKIAEATGLEIGVVRAGVEPNYGALIQVASVQSLGSRMDNLGRIGLVICDEAHHSVSKSWRSILSQFPNQYILGVTATPARLDGSGFIDQYDALIQGESVRELIDQGVLSKYRLYAAPEAMNTESVKKQNGDYSVADLAKQNNVVTLSGHLIESYRRHADGLQAVVFAINIEHSQAIADRYNREGITAAHLDGKTPAKKRAEVIAAFRRGEIRVLTNCNLFDEGFDLPSLGCVQIARPTQSLGRYLQMLGRGARCSEGKDCAIYIDHTQNYLIHGLPDADRVWSLDGVKSDLKPIKMGDGSEVVAIEDKKDPRTIVELEYIVLEETIKNDAELIESQVTQEKAHGVAENELSALERIEKRREAQKRRQKETAGEINKILVRSFAERLFPSERGDEWRRCEEPPSYPGQCVENKYIYELNDLLLETFLVNVEFRATTWSVDVQTTIQVTIEVFCADSVLRRKISVPVHISKDEWDWKLLAMTHPMQAILACAGRELEMDFDKLQPVPVEELDIYMVGGDQESGYEWDRVGYSCGHLLSAHLKRIFPVINGNGGVLDGGQAHLSRAFSGQCLSSEEDAEGSDVHWDDLNDDDGAQCMERMFHKAMLKDD